MNTLRYEASTNWIPEELEKLDVTNFRYIKDVTEETKRKILDIAENADMQERILKNCPHKNAAGAWDVSTIDVRDFLSTLCDMDESASRAASRIIDQHLTAQLQGGVLIMSSGMTDDDVTNAVMKSRENGKLRETTYESMPTTIISEVEGGISLAIIRIKDGDPETVEHEHVHNGSRLVTCLSDEAVLVLPNKNIALSKGDAVWMAPFTLHSFQKGDFLALHTSEAGFDHPEAFLPYRENK